MVLNGDAIKEYVKKNQLIENANLENIRSSSYDVTTDEYILKFKKEEYPISLLNAQKIENMYEQIKIDNGYNLEPGECILIVLEEKFNIPNDICGSIRGRTSFNRLGLNIIIQHLNPGFNGKLNLTLINNSVNTYIITPKIQIAQVVFEKLNNAVNEELLYNNEKNHSYQNSDGVQGSKVYTDYIGKVVRHFKGNYYFIENICMNSETKEYMVIYRTLYNHKDSNIWTRPAKMFFEDIDPNRNGNITKQTHRFEIVDDLTIDYTKIK